MPITEEQLEYLVSHAALAPSSHNTQPWRFEITDGELSLFADRERALPENDPLDRELTISCGCALMNLRVAAAQQGIAVALDPEPASGDDDLLARVSFDNREAVSTDEAELFKSVAERRTYRKPFASKEASTAILDTLTAAALEEGARLSIVESQEDRQKVAELVAEGDRMQWSNPAWRGELAGWMHSRRCGDGLTVPGVIAPFAKFFIRAFDMGKGVAAKDKKLAEEAPVLAVLGSTDDNPADWLAVGQALEKLLLAAHLQGLQASYLNQPIQVASLRTELQSLLDLQVFPQILLRIGFPVNEIDAAPRRPLNEVIG